MTASFASALKAAREAAGSQNYPQGALYVVATPIGNLADISLRALHVLERVDAIACEDTRHTQTLLRALGLERPSGGLIAVHQHNEAEAAQQVLARLQAGQRVAYASDAGTPAVSDPGARLVAAVHAAGQRVIPLPGASSVTADRAAAIASAAGCIRAQWKGALTGSSRARLAPRALAISSARSTAPRCPETTTWAGSLSFAAWQTSP